MTTPTPGDLSARQVIADMQSVAELRTIRHSYIGEKLKGWIAALFALPAAGEAVGYTSMGEFRYACDCDEEMRATWQPVWFKPTTPQPSAAVLEDGGSPCSTHPDAPHGFNRNASHTEDRYVCDCEGWKPDAAVGAQGDGWIEAEEMADTLVGIAHLIHHSGGGYPRLLDDAKALRKVAEWIKRIPSAAPAAGKGVDDLLDLATLYGDHSVDSRNRESWDFDAHGLKQLAAALTRQPVAGDGDADFELWQDGEFVAGSSGPRAEAWREILHYAAQYEQDGAVTIMEVIRRPLAAPAATPTDGGEGNNAR